MKRFMKLTVLYTLIVSLFAAFVVPVSADEAINEKAWRADCCLWR